MNAPSSGRWLTPNSPAAPIPTSVQGRPLPVNSPYQPRTAAGRSA